MVTATPTALRLFDPECSTEDTASIDWEPWIQTHSGTRFYYEPHTASRVNIGDIATALTRQPRWCGHTFRFYSVAQHCVETSRLVEAMGGTLVDQLLALLHDSTEAYLADVPSPAKRRLSQYKAIETDVWAQISRVFFGGVVKLPAIVKQADLVMLATEGRDLMRPTLFMPELPAADVPKLRPWFRWNIRRRYLARFHFLLNTLRENARRRTT